MDISRLQKLQTELFYILSSHPCLSAPLSLPPWSEETFSEILHQVSIYLADKTNVTQDEERLSDWADKYQFYSIHR